MKSALIIRHVPVEGIAGFREAIEQAGYHLDRVDVTDPQFGALDLTEPDLLIMMGGPMAVYDQAKHPWIACQQRRLAQRLERDRPTLGVCFGAQLIASALGAAVFPGPVKEVGFHRLTIVPSLAAAPLRHLQDLPVLHWHGDTFTLPAGAERLASSERYDNQAFRLGQNILALQFHAEMGLDARFDTWVEQWPDDIAAAGTTPEQLRADHACHGPALVAAGREMIRDWLATLG
jgi:GMP synthase (glutamine-hydrolysing)